MLTRQTKKVDGINLMRYDDGADHRIDEGDTMRASDFIDELQSLVRRHGDLQVIDSEGRQIDVEFNDDGEAAFVVE